MISQTKGLAFEFGKDIIEIKTNIIFPWSRLQPGFLPIFRWIFKNKIPENNIPEIVISCGRKSVYLSIYLKKKYPQIINIHIQNPKVSSQNFSYIIAPNHDGYTGENIINSVGALHQFKVNNNIKRNANEKNNQLISCIIGGENNHYIFSLKEAEDLCSKITNLKSQNPNIQLLIITSRRTSLKIKNYLQNKMKSIAKLWLGQGENPYEYAINNSNFFIITSDSTSMISEASISGNPIYVYHLPYKRKSLRFMSFHEEFRNLKITKDFTAINSLEKWSYEILDESKRIAGIIKKRIIQGIHES